MAKAKSASRPTPVQSKSTPAAAPKSGGTTGANLLQQYQNALSGGVGRGTEGNPLADFRQGAEALWDASGNLRSYADRLRSESRAHEQALQGNQLKSQEAQTRMQTNAQKKVAATGASASRFAASVGADTEKYLARLGLEGTKIQTRGRIKESTIQANAQRDVTSMQVGAQKYTADLGLKSDLAGYASNEKIAGMDQAGQNYRAGLNLAGSLLMNKDDNYTARTGKFWDYMGNVAQSQWRAPDANNIRYWS